MTDKKDKQLDKQFKVQILIAIIGLIGVIAVPLIDFLGEKWGSTSTKNIPTVSTPEFVFNKFDDPLELFSVNYPSNFYVAKRNTNDSTISITVIPNGLPLSDLENLNNENVAAIDVFIAKVNYTGTVEDFTNDFINNIAFNDSYHDSKSKRILISNEVVRNGYRVHFQEIYSEKSSFDYFLWSELNSKTNTVVLLTIVLGDKSLPIYGSAVDSIIESFTWNPEKASKLLK